MIALENPIEDVTITIDFQVIKSEGQVQIKNVLLIDDKRTYEYLKLYSGMHQGMQKLISTEIFYKTANGEDVEYGKQNCFSAQID